MLPTLAALTTLVLAFVTFGCQVVMPSHFEQGAGLKRHARHATIARRHAHQAAHHNDTDARLTKRGKTPSTEVFTGCACSMRSEVLSQSFSLHYCLYHSQRRDVLLRCRRRDGSLWSKRWRACQAFCRVLRVRQVRRQRAKGNPQDDRAVWDQSDRGGQLQKWRIQVGCAYDARDMRCFCGMAEQAPALSKLCRLRTRDLSQIRERSRARRRECVGVLNRVRIWLIMSSGSTFSGTSARPATGQSPFFTI